MMRSITILSLIALLAGLFARIGSVTIAPAELRQVVHEGSTLHRTLVPSYVTAHAGGLCHGDCSPAGR